MGELIVIDKTLIVIDKALGLQISERVPLPEQLAHALRSAEGTLFVVVPL